MKPINFPESNLTLGKPEGWTDEECSALPVYAGYTDEAKTRPYVNSLWQPSEADIKAINEGRPVVLSMSVPHNHVPPASVFTYDENGNLNPQV